MNVKVNTKKMPNGEWSCFTTYKGIDKAFVGNISVVSEMANWLKGLPIENIIWNDPVIHLPKEKESNYKFRRPKLDVGMV